MDVGMLHTHHLMGVLFFLSLVALTFFPKVLEKVRFLRISVETLLLGTGLYLVFRSPGAFTSAYILKYLLVVGIIILAVVGSRKGNKALGITSLVLTVYVYGLSRQRDIFLRSPSAWAHALETPIPSLQTGQALYETYCSRCHGKNGAAGYLKSPNLTQSQQDTVYWQAIIKAGKGLMPAHPYLTQNQIQSLILYLQAFRQRE
ncbi:MAG: c-type cytochrome [Bacteroidia bacterium]